MIHLYKLIEQHKNKDEDAFLEILEMFEPLINSLYRKGVNEDMKSDLTLFLFELLNKMQFEKEIFKQEKYIVSYISKSLKNKYIYLNKNHYKKKCSELKLEETYLNLGKNSYFSEIFFDDLIKNLKDVEKDILIKRYKLDYSDQEIATLRGVSRQSVCKIRTNALKKLKKVNINVR